MLRTFVTFISRAIEQPLLDSSTFSDIYDPSHFHHDTALGCTKKLISTDLPDETMFYMRILSQLTAIGGAAIPTHFQSDPDLAHHWSSQNLEEQIALAEILILIFYNNVSCSPSVIQKVLYRTLPSAHLA
ncbi:hypothetical protein BASA83_009989 [Batrachochytrium salamandrivorans]|nr:hypothetical protein BASA83_009989 [Batrachochytrium salamandrivorans]